MTSRLLVLSVILLAAAPALAQTDFMSLGKKALQSVEGQSGGGGGNASLGAGLSDGEITTGIKDALRVGTQKAVAAVGHAGGFLNDTNVHIPLPGPLAKIKMGLSAIGAGGLAEDLEQRINRAAETAAPLAAGIFGDAVGAMSLQDARGILTGPSDSATQYFKRTTTPQLTQAIKPIVDQSLSNAGAVKSLNTLTTTAKALPLPPSLDLDLGNYVTGKTLDGIFFYLAQQEANIRANPAARTTDALRAVFQ